MINQGYLLALGFLALAAAIYTGRKRIIKHLSRFAIMALGLPIKELHEQIEDLQSMLATKGSSMGAYLNFEKFMANLPVGVIVADVPKRGGSQIVYANGKAAAILGYEPHELIGLSIKALVPDDRKEAQESAFRRAAATKDYMRRPWPEAALMKDGSRIIIEHMVSDYTDEQGVHFLATIIPARK